MSKTCLCMCTYSDTQRWHPEIARNWCVQKNLSKIFQHDQLIDKYVYSCMCVDKKICNKCLFMCACVRQRGIHGARLLPSCVQGMMTGQNRHAVWSSGAGQRSHCSGCSTARTSTTSAPSLASLVQRTASRWSETFKYLTALWLIAHENDAFDLNKSVHLWSHSLVLSHPTRWMSEGNRNSKLFSRAGKKRSTLERQ